jgi:hypothetical protein
MKNYINHNSPGEKARDSEIKATEILHGASFAGEVPNSHSLYDLDWKGKKIEVKMSTTYPAWNWIVSSKQTKIIDFVLLMGYDQSIFKKAFLIPRKEIIARNSYRGLGFRIVDKNKIPSKYAKYEVFIKSSYK